MKPMSTPRRLLQLDALFGRRQAWGGPGARREAREPQFEDTRMPDDIDVLALQRLAGTQVGRIAAEVALEEGARRVYAPRSEAEVIEARR
jgi:hypothetical protein